MAVAGSTGLIVFWISMVVAQPSSLKVSTPAQRNLDAQSGLKSPKAGDRLDALSRIHSGQDRLDEEKIKSARQSEGHPLVRHRLNQALVEHQASGTVALLIDSLEKDESPMVR